MDVNWPLIVSILASILLLSTIVLIKARRPNWLDIETKWLTISAFPILIGLFLGGYITSFKGLGIEIEASLKQPVKDITTIIAQNNTAKAAEALVSESGTTKDSVDRLSSLTEDEKKQIERLAFKNNYKNYSVKAVKSYEILLPNLKYIELLNEDSKFIGVMSAKDLLGKEARFVDSLRAGNILIDFSKIIITNYVDYKASAIDALKSMNDNKVEYLPLVDENHSMKGIVTESSLAKSIAKKVLAASN